MQLLPLLDAKAQIYPFSILGRIGGDATPPLPQEAMPYVFFQYPRSDRRRCNLERAGFSVFLGVFLSVSSVGSEAMQLPEQPSPGRVCTPFSILGRIGGDATLAGMLSACRCGCFQYPRSDRRRCNSGTTIPRQGMQAFQYPRSDRRRCNPLLSVVHSDYSPLFQYPRSDRRRCNFSCFFFFGSGAKLSVSSVGSEAMQQTPAKLGGAGQAAFSILGRIGGDATFSPCIIGSRFSGLTFSILGRIGGDATGLGLG